MYASQSHQIHICSSRATTLCFGDRVEFVPAIWTAIRIFKPLLDTMITENVTAFWQSERDLLDPFWSFDAILVVANDTTWGY